jgi:hypothetical protein
MRVQIIGYIFICMYVSKRRRTKIMNSIQTNP